jgi:hypothetical protein
MSIPAWSDLALAASRLGRSGGTAPGADVTCSACLARVPAASTRTIAAGQRLCLDRAACEATQPPLPLVNGR